MLSKNKQGYYVDDKTKQSYVSVTKVLAIYPKPWLSYWYGKVGTKEAQRVSKEATEIGTALHELKSKFFAEEEVEIGKYKNKYIQTAYKSFLKWWKEKKEPERETIYDFKVSDRQDITYWLQLHAYGASTPHKELTKTWNDEILLVNGEYAGTADLVYRPKKKTEGFPDLKIVNLGKEEVKFTESSMLFHDEYYQVFLSMLEFYKQMINLEKEHKLGCNPKL